MSKKYLDYDGLLYFWGKLKAYFVPQTRKINNQPLSADVTIAVPSAGTGSSYPAMDGTRSLGSNAGFARVDHVHPSDTSRVPTTRTINGHALSANITLDADDVGALPDSTAIPTKTSDLTNDSDFVSDASYTHTDNNFTTTDKTKLDTLIFTNGVIDSSILPSYVDDVIEAYPRSGATELSSAWLSLTSGGSALTPESGKIYVLMADSTSYSANSQFRWSGTTYVKLSDGGVSEITNAEIDTIVAS